MANKKPETEGQENNGFMMKVAAFIIDKRNLFFLIFAIAVVFSLVSKNWVTVENDITAYLSEDTETKKGLNLMAEEYTTYGSAEIMVTNITYEDAEELAEKIKARDDVAMVQFDDSDAHYSDFSALFSVTFIYPEDDEQAVEALTSLEDQLSDYDIYVSSDLADNTSEVISGEMSIITIYVAVVVVLVLIFTCDSFAEIPVLIITFLVAAKLSDGTNFLLGSISFISDSVTIVLQLALSVDYAVILMNKYKEFRKTMDARSADITALSKAIVEISASSLTTIGGLIAMLFMQFGIGPDMGIVLIKAIILSLLTVFLLMPGLIMVFDKYIALTSHKSFIPRVDFIGKIAYKLRHVVPIVFLAVIAVGFYLSQNCPYAYGYSTISAIKESESKKIEAMINDTFVQRNVVALNVPGNDYKKEARMIDYLVNLDEVYSAVGLANTEAMNGETLTAELNAREFAEMINVDSDVGTLLYAAYAVNDEDYGKVLSGSGDYKVPFIDMFLFLHEEVENGYITLDSDQQETVDEAYNSIIVARNQLQGENYDRILLYLTLPVESDETFEFLDDLHVIAKEYYGEDAEIVVTGESTSEYDLKKSFERDNIVVTAVSMLAVLVVLLFTFNSAGMPVLLLAVIEGCIWINFSWPTISQHNIFFLTYLIVSSIQMGANIDYAIVVSSRYQEIKRTMSPRDAIIDTMNYAFPTIVTSGTMLAMSGVLIGFLTSEPIISSVGVALGRGTFISIFMVLFALPEILLIGDKIIDKTSFDMNLSLPVQERKIPGVVRLDGMVNGHIEGEFIGVVHGTLIGEVDVRVMSKSGLSITKKDDENKPDKDANKRIEENEAQNQTEDMEGSDDEK